MDRKTWNILPMMKLVVFYEFRDLFFQKLIHGHSFHLSNNSSTKYAVYPPIYIYNVTFMHHTLPVNYTTNHTHFMQQFETTNLRYSSFHWQICLMTLKVWNCCRTYLQLCLGLEREGTGSTQRDKCFVRCVLYHLILPLFIVLRKVKSLP